MHVLFGAKSSWKPEEIDVRTNIEKCDGIEIQLLGKDDKFYSDNWLDNINISKITAIHMPLDLSNNNDFLIETPDGFEIFQETIKRAQKIQDMNKNPMAIVAHMENSVKNLEALGLYKDLINNIRYEMIKYPTIDLCIENTAMGEYLYDFPNVQAAKDVNLPNVGTVLDTCHMLTHLKVIESLIENNLEADEWTMRDYFEKNKHFCKHLHLANSEYGNKKVGGRTRKVLGLYGGHGSPFIDKNNENLQKIIECLKNYRYDVNIIHEVPEDDYSKPENYLAQIETFSHFLKK